MSGSRLRTPLCDLLGIRVPILLAGMANGPSTPELAAAVTRAGGLGVLAASGLTCAELERDMARVRELVPGGRFGVNAQLAGPTPATGERARIVAVLAPFRRELGLPDEPPEPAPAASAVELIECALAGGAAVITTFDDPAPVAEATHAAGARLLPMVTTVGEARRARACGADGLIAQGGEAGGHRGTYGGGEARGGGTVALVPQVADEAAGLPVLASGGIMDGRGIVAALALGAQGVSLGTCFLASAESGVAEAYAAVVPETRAERTVVTDLVTGRPARWIRNRLLDALVEADPGTLGWGPQTRLVADLRRAASEQGRADILPMLAGEGAALSAEREPAARIVARLEREAEAVLAALTTGPAGT
ncbi:MAG TPA: nitronate monooxygenase [Gaiellales bacterium]